MAKLGNAAQSALHKHEGQTTLVKPYLPCLAAVICTSERQANRSFRCILPDYRSRDSESFGVPDSRIS